MQETRAKEISLRPIAELVPSPKNRNKHSDEQVAALAESIRVEGIRNPLIVSNRSGHLVCGHGRLLALKKLGAEVAPVMFQDFDSEASEYAYGVSDNALAKRSELDFSGIHFDIAEIGPFDLDQLGIKDFKLEPDPEPEKKEKKKKVCPNCSHEW